MYRKTLSYYLIVCIVLEILFIIAVCGCGKDSDRDIPAGPVNYAGYLLPTTPIEVTDNQGTKWSMTETEISWQDATGGTGTQYQPMSQLGSLQVSAVPSGDVNLKPRNRFLLLNEFDEATLLIQANIYQGIGHFAMTFGVLVHQNNDWVAIKSPVWGGYETEVIQDACRAPDKKIWASGIYRVYKIDSVGVSSSSVLPDHPRPNEVPHKTGLYKTSTKIISTTADVLTVQIGYTSDNNSSVIGFPNLIGSEYWPPDAVLTFEYNINVGTWTEK